MVKKNSVFLVNYVITLHIDLLFTYGMPNLAVWEKACSETRRLFIPSAHKTANKPPTNKTVQQAVNYKITMHGKTGSAKLPPTKSPR